MPADEPKTEAEFLERESRMAREALLALRDKFTESLSRTPDVAAWTERYPWGSLGAAAASGLAAGVAVGKATHKSPPPAVKPDQQGVEAHQLESSTAQAAARPSSRLISGLGALASAAMSAATVAATQAISEIVKDSIHEAMNPDKDQATEEP
jgi:hypothetical protein